MAVVRRAPPFLLATLIAALVLAPAARSIGMPTYGKAFCRGGLVHDYERILDQMPPVHRPPESEDLPFGPRNMPLYRSAMSRVLVGEGGFGYRFFDDTFGVRPEVRLFWDVTTTVSRVDGKGRILRTIDSESQYLGVVRQIGDLDFWLDVPRGPALYRYDIEFRSHASGDVLGSYSEYFRLVKPTYHLRLAVTRPSFAAGETAYARVENWGTIWAFFGLPFDVERFQQGTWSNAPGGPGGDYWPAVGLTMQGGSSGWCMRYPVPVDAEPGRYRFVRDIQPMRRGAHERSYTAEFRVTG